MWLNLESRFLVLGQIYDFQCSLSEFHCLEVFVTQFCFIIPSFLFTKYTNSLILLQSYCLQDGLKFHSCNRLLILPAIRILHVLTKLRLQTPLNNNMHVSHLLRLINTFFFSFPCGLVCCLLTHAYLVYTTISIFFSPVLL